jgi:H+/Cl- antiporter ClcA
VGGDGADEGTRAGSGSTPTDLLRALVVAVVLGAIGALVTVGFVYALEGTLELLWEVLPEALGVDAFAAGYLVPVVLVGALLLGVGRARLGEYPVSLEQAIEDRETRGGFDHRHIWQAVVLSLVSLGFGAALGPEAALVAVVGGLATWIGRALADRSHDEAVIGGISGALGALFSTAGAAALTMDRGSSTVAEVRSGRLWRLVPAVAAGLAGLWVYRLLGPAENYFDIGVPDYHIEAVDLAWALLVTAAGVTGGALFLLLGRATDRLLAPLDARPVLESLVGGVGLALLGTTSSLMLFSGHEGVRTLITDYGDDSVRFLVLAGVGKLVAASLLLSAKWKGGRFFPLMFTGAALGLACSQAIGGIDEVVGLAAGMTGAVAVLLGRPALAALFMVWFFPPPAWPIVAIAAVVGGIAGRRLAPRLAHEG